MKRDTDHHLHPLQLKGLEIIATGSLQASSSNSYKIKLATGKTYHVTWRQLKWRCTCKSTHTCEHIYAVLFSKLNNPAIRELPDVACPDCGSSDLIKRGTRKNKHGLIQRYSCSKCGLRFDDRQGFCKMKGSPEAITVTLDLWYKGLSLNKIADHLDQFYGIKTCPSTMYGWIEKYTTIMKRYTRKLKIASANKWHADETVLGVRGRSYYFWTAMDNRTRFIIATYLSKRRRSKDADELFRKGLKRVLKAPRKIVTDGLSSYTAPIVSIGRASGGSIQHLRGKSFTNKQNNNIMERFNGTLRERTKVMRGLHNRRSAEIFTDGFAEYYNFIRPNQALSGRTPAEKARLLESKTGNRWTRLLREALQNQHRKRS